MLLNKEEKKYKHYLSLQEALGKNWEAQSALGYVELENPIPCGWDVTIVPRQDIQNREDADDFWELIDIIVENGFIRKKSWFKSRKAKYQQYPFRPKYRLINEFTFSKLSSKLRKHFTYSDRDTNQWSGKMYFCNVPYFYWEHKLVRRYITHKKILDVELLREEAEIQAAIEYEKDKNHFGYRYGNAPKDYRRSFNRTFKSQCKQTLHNIVYKGKEQEFPAFCLNAAWYYW